jgi:ribonuclease HI
MTEKLIVYTDGGARGNPGPAGIGVVIMDGEKVLESFGKYIGETTNNQAEYQALIAALHRAFELSAKEVECRMDSELAVKQMRREYKVRDKGLLPLFVRSNELVAAIGNVRFVHVRREYNKLADAEVNNAIDRAIK